MPDSWGPSPTDVAHAAHSLYNASTVQPSVSSDDEGGNEDFSEGEDDEFMAEMEEAAYVNEYRVVDSDLDDLEYWDEVHVPSSPIHH